MRAAKDRTRVSGVYQIPSRPAWTSTPHAVHEKLREYVMRRLMPQRGVPGAWHQMFDDAVDGLLEREFLEEEKASIASWARRAPACPEAFADWISNLRRVGPGQPLLYQWLDEQGDVVVLRRYLEQQLAVRGHLESLMGQAELGLLPEGCMLAFSGTSHWDAVQSLAGRDTLRAVIGVLGGGRKPGVVECWEANSVTNLLVGLVCNPSYAFQAVGALCAVDLQAAVEAPIVARALSQVGVGAELAQRYRDYTASAERRLANWEQTFTRLLASDPRLVTPIAEGTLMLQNAQARFLRRCRTDASANVRSRVA